ncbi:tetratricopeptide repeat protein [Marinibaculum pumilum]|uniref:protein O-GlcNAc transferase n=1 Tax=Marinibaculum pumilum TaxID=1766165 RepID=A0ABV7KZ46_9PROT
MADLRLFDAGASSAMPLPAPMDPGQALHRATRMILAGRVAEGRALLEDLVTRQPAIPDAWNNLASARRTLGDVEGALAAIARAVALAPERAEFRYNHGNALRAANRDSEATEAYRAAIARQPDHSMAWNGLGLCLAADRGLAAAQRLSGAGRAYRRALVADTGNGKAWNNLGAIYYEENLPYRALACLRQAAAADPAFAMPYNNMANIYRDIGRMEDAFGCFRTALRLDPDYRDAHTNLIFSLDFDSSQTTELQQAERRRWAERHAALPALPARPGPDDPQRPLQVGYISGDFRVHSAAATFAAPILHHDRDRFRITCYYTDTVEDPSTARFREAADRWRAIGSLSDEALAQQVRADEIDILVDLSGHTNGHRLGAFARRPAPVQVTGWGHCTGTGMAQMDALLVDSVLVPQDERTLFAERIVDLPCALSFEPFQTPPAPAPAQGHWHGTLRSGPDDVVFGALGRGGKAGPDSIRLWAQVLQAVPGSRLFLKDRQYEDRLRRRDILHGFAEMGIGADRIAFGGRTDWRGHLSSYWNVDIALDTTPQGGGVTTLEALWMGVPMITLYGRFPSSRIAASILSACGRSEWIARDEAGFAAIARDLAANVAKLRSGRVAQREALTGMPPYDPPAYARAVEAAYRTLWKEHCTRTAASR